MKLLFLLLFLTGCASPNTVTFPRIVRDHRLPPFAAKVEFLYETKEESTVNDYHP